MEKRESGCGGDLRPSKDLHSTREGNRERYILNQRFAWDIRYTPHWFHIQERDERIVDIKTAKVLARYVDFSTDIPPIALGARRSGAYKLWMMKGSCEVGPEKLKEMKFNDLFSSVKKLGRAVNEYQ